MHIVLVYRYYNDGIVYYNLTFCTRKSLMTDLGLTTDSVVSSLRTLNFCGFRAFRGRTIRTLNFWIPCVLWEFPQG